MVTEKLSFWQKINIYLKLNFFLFLKHFFQIFLTLTMCLTIGHGYKVLFLGPFNGKSHFLYMQSFVLALIDRGHEVTFLTSQSINHIKLKNYTEILIDPPFDIHSLCKFNNHLQFMRVYYTRQLVAVCNFE